MQELILIEDVETLGRRGSMVRVRDGYSRNFLLPRRLAVLATRDNLKRLEGLRKRFQEEESERIARAKTHAEKLEGRSITVTVKTSEEGHLYGSVNVAVLVESLAAEGIVLEARQVRLADPIKEIGVYQVPIVLHDDVRTSIKVWVVSENAAAAGEAAEATGATGAEPAAEAAAEPESEGA